MPSTIETHFDIVRDDADYNMYDQPLPTGSNFVACIRDQFFAFDGIARKNGLRLIPNVMPGYDDTGLRGARRDILDRQDGQFYRNYGTMSSEFVDSHQPFLFITSFNEWHEGSELEPSAE